MVIAMETEDHLVALHLILVIPIVLIGMRYGSKAGFATAFAFLGALAGWDILSDARWPALSYLDHMAVYFTVAFLAGRLDRGSAMGASAGDLRVAPEAQKLLSTLTPRELEVLALMARGDTNSDIAERLVISEDTVKSHVKHILRKLNARNRVGAVLRYLRAKGIASLRGRAPANRQADLDQEANVRSNPTSKR